MNSYQIGGSLLIIIGLIIMIIGFNASKIEVTKIEQLSGGVEDYATAKYRVSFKQGKKENTVIIYSEGREYCTTKQRVYYNEDGKERGNNDAISEAVDTWARAKRLNSIEP